METSRIEEKKELAIRETVQNLFKTRKGDPLIFTPGQCAMFDAVVNPIRKWVWMSAPTRYGKSECLAIALLYLAAFGKLKIPIVAGTEEKARKIMEYVVQHVSDHPLLYQGLLGYDVRQVDRLMVQMSKQGLRWRDGGWIYITSVSSRTLITEGEKVVGEGGDVVVLEEAGLIRHKEQFSKVVRMPEGEWGKLIMSGNAIEKSVFENAYNNDLYYKVRITLDQAIREGRFNRGRLEQQKSQTTSKDWKRYYLVEFPQASEYAFFKSQKYEFLPLEMLYCGAVDLSLGEGKTELGIRKRSKTGIVILGVDEKGQVYEVESMEESMGPDSAIRTILNFPYEFHRFGVESIQFQKYFLKVIDQKSKEMGKYIPFIGLEQKRKKEERIESLEPLINTGQILFKGGNDLWAEMQDYPDVEWLDALDSLEMAWRLAKMIGIELGTIRRKDTAEKPAGKHYQLIDPSRWKE